MVPVEEMIAVTGESPALEPEPRLDERRLSTGATVSQGELDKIPDTRDPYEILQSEPGAPADRINVGGNESGRQAQWSVDGVVITDMAALGNPPVHFILDPFEKTIPALSEAEAKSLCAEIAQTGWDWITRERALALAPALNGGIEKAYDAGLLRGFLAVALQDTGCAEPPAEVLAEALRYLDRFMPPRG